MANTTGALERIRGLTEALQRLAVSSDLEEMDRILAERRRLLEELSPEPAGRPDPARGELLRQVLELDRQTEEALRRQGDEMRAELIALGHGRRGLAGYRSSGSSRSKWIDEQG